MRTVAAFVRRGDFLLLTGELREGPFRKREASVAMADTKDTIPKKRKRREQEEKDGSNGPKKKSKSSNRTRMKVRF